MKRLFKQRKTLYFVLGIIIISVFAITVAYAVLSTTLNITGETEITASDWHIFLENYKTPVTTGSATYTTPTLSGTTIANYSVGLTKPGDSVTLYFLVQNYGTLNGEISSITSSTPTCTSETGNTADANLVCNNLKIDFKYTDSSVNPSYYNISVGDVINTHSSTCFNGSSEISLNSFTILQLTISLNESMTSVSSSKVNVSNLNNTIVYSQTNKECVNNSDTPEVM